MREAVKFLHYGFISTDEIAMEWLASLPKHLDRGALILAAGYEPDDGDVRLGVLRTAWGDHEAGCLLVSHGRLAVNRRFALSEKPLVNEDAWATSDERIKAQS